MATIKAIEGRSIHQIQSGQVIVDLTSVVKELVENSLDAGATSIDVRFKSQGLDAIEVQDNGSGISKNDYETLGLKHYTSKLSTYNDLAKLDTFGFRGEAISSLCALSNLHVITAQDGEAPKGTKLKFENSGKLKDTSVAATQKGTLVVVEDLFQALPVRRRELEKNIKREYAKVINILNAYACISIGVRFSVSQQTGKGKKTVVFSTRNNLSTKENIANVYGAKTIAALVALNLDLEMQPTKPSQVLKDIRNENSVTSGQINVEGHISKPVHGEGRQAPDRQMFFVNSRPCGLPQVAKAFNEVYRLYNVMQSPFIFANFKIDTNAYDVNVSPDKRTIMLHDQQQLLDTVKDALVNLFESQDQTIPTQQPQDSKLVSFKPLPEEKSGVKASENEQDPTGSARSRKSYDCEDLAGQDEEHHQTRSERIRTPGGSTLTSSFSSSTAGSDQQSARLISAFAARNTTDRREALKPSTEKNGLSEDKIKLSRKLERATKSRSASIPESEGISHVDGAISRGESGTPSEDSEALSGRKLESSAEPQSDALETQSTQRPGRSAVVTTPLGNDPTESGATPEVIGEMTVGPTMSKVANGVSTKRRRLSYPDLRQKTGSTSPQTTQFSSTLKAFIAPGSKFEGKEGREYSSDSAQPSVAKYMLPPQTHDESDVSAESSSEEEADSQGARNDSPDDNCFDEEKLKAQEEARIKKMVQEAEQAITQSSQENERRAARVLKRSGDKLFNIVQNSDFSLADVGQQQMLLEACQHEIVPDRPEAYDEGEMSSHVSAEERLSLTISKSDFSHMRIVGQFNLGFILAVRPSSLRREDTSSYAHDELFIIDQHASDEIFNFHRLSDTTTLTPQPLVRPHSLQLTAIEEEIILDHKDASLAKNGFNIAVDTSGAAPVGERCKLLTLPTSKETVFDTRDLEELLVMLADVPAPNRSSPPLPDIDTSEHLEGISSHRILSLSDNSTPIVRPTKVRRMLAMRACRSSIMVGKALTTTGMAKVVKHMGEIERPWNCPHGRPTMRHVSALGALGGWNEWSAFERREHEMNAGAGEDGESVWLPPGSQGDSGMSANDEGESNVWRQYINAYNADSGVDKAETR